MTLKDKQSERNILREKLDGKIFKHTLYKRTNRHFKKIKSQYGGNNL